MYLPLALEAMYNRLHIDSLSFVVVDNIEKHLLSEDNLSFNTDGYINYNNICIQERRQGIEKRRSIPLGISRVALFVKHIYVNFFGKRRTFCPISVSLLDEMQATFHYILPIC